MNFFKLLFGSVRQTTPPVKPAEPEWKQVKTEYDRLTGDRHRSAGAETSQQRTAADEPSKVTGAKVAQPFTDNQDGTVTDIGTGLIWQKNDDGQKRTWSGALEYAKSLSLAGHSDWRVPTKSELVSLRDNAGRKREIRMAFFPGTKEAEYWTSSTYVNNSGDAYYVSFNSSAIFSMHSLSYCYKDRYTYHVRCVRSLLSRDDLISELGKMPTSSAEESKRIADGIVKLGAPCFAMLKTIAGDKDVDVNVRKDAIAMGTRFADPSWSSFLSQNFVIGKNPQALYAALENGDSNALTEFALFREAKEALEGMGYQLNINSN